MTSIVKINIIWIKKNILRKKIQNLIALEPLSTGDSASTTIIEKVSTVLLRLSLLITIFYILVLNILILVTDDKI